MDMNLQKYLAFVATAEYGSFTRAAEALHYSQSGVSRMIADLEQEWGLTLLERSRSGVCLTGDGVRLLPLAQRLCADFQQLETQVDELNGLQAGLIRIGTFSSVAAHWLPSMIRAFQQDYPNIDYELVVGYYPEIEEWIADGRVDCGFVSLPTRAEFETVFLSQDRLLAVLPEGHPLQTLDKLPLRALCDEPFMLLEKGAQAEISHLFQTNGLSPNVKFTTLDDYAVMSMVESGLGVAILPELILRRVPYRIIAKELDVPAYRRIGFAMKSKKAAPLAVRRFMDYLQFR